ncbi:MAG: hypothetical protein KJ018_09670, partial [Burkholderiales bacterium]|nr:hypothetical protein [Burkholderiales bacterium]
MAVNGGGLLTLDFAASGRLPAQRTVRVPWGEYVNVADVALIPLDGAVTSIAANGATPQVHQGSQQTDASGTRRATILFPPGTGAMMLLPGGVTQPLATLAVRATEYTVGPNGPLAMPGLLPPTSGYTYAVEVSVDQAIAAGASRVQFSQPVPVYVDNFLNFPAGTIVPAGVYDRTAAQWVAMPNGIVAKVVAVAAGAADLDVSGDDLADDPATVLAPLGITLAERQVLATLFAVGASFWRTPVTHFSPLDFNWPYAPPSDAKGAGTEGATTDETLDQCLDEAAGSIIECQNQILGQSVALAGTPYTLNYRSDRVPGREAARTIDVAASGAVVPGSLKRIEVTLSVAGQEFTQALPPVANQRPQVIWDGKDAYGRTVQGRQTFGGTLDYVYDAVYTSPSQLGPAFAQFGGAPITADPARMEFRFPQLLAGRVGIMDARGVGVGGWTLSPHHTYDPDGQVLYHGSGKRLAVGPIPYVTTVVAGSMTADNQEFNNLPATSFALDEDAIGLAAGPDGSFYFTHGCLVRKVDPAGILTVVAGTLQGQNHVCGYGGDGGAATLALLDEPTGLAVAPDGSLYVADKRNHRIRRIDPAGVIRTIAGNGVEGFSGDGGLAVNASIDINGWDFTGVAAGADGSVYFLDRSNARVRRVDPAGIITTIAGGGPQGPLGCQMFEGLPATQGCLFNAQGGVAVAADGTVFVAAFSSVIGVRPDGTAFVAAGDQFVGGSSGDGGLARLARLDQPIALAVGPDGSLYIGDSDNRRIRRVSPGGVITTFAGGGSNGNGDGVDGLPATQLQLNGLGLFGIAVAPDHSVLATQRSTIRRFHPPLPDFLAAP